jgi:hypothetical protein
MENMQIIALLESWACSYASTDFHRDRSNVEETIRNIKSLSQDLRMDIFRMKARATRWKKAAKRQRRR